MLVRTYYSLFYKRLRCLKSKLNCERALKHNSFPLQQSNSKVEMLKLNQLHYPKYKIKHKHMVMLQYIELTQPA